ncbi:MAG: alpha/beta fold hydrolase [Myxococcales bacterium]|nr:alpha/beta fold hydrolase [Myxococcales bacterium]
MTLHDPRTLALLTALSILACDPGESEPDDDDATSTTQPGGGADVPGGTEHEQPTCEAEGLRSLVRPVDPADPYGETFTYYYQWIDRPGDGPTIVHIPGGPGLGSIGHLPEGIPDDVDVVLTDPRGVGCNADGSPHEAAFYGTEKFSTDVLAIIEDLRLDDYVIYGHSYGTVLSTVVAARTTEAGVQPPRLVVLEGTLGHAMASDDVAYRELWPKVRDALPPDVQAKLMADPLPLGKAPGVWGETITTVLSQYSPEVLLTLLGSLADGGDTTELEGLMTAITGGPPMWEDEVMMGLFQPVACNEIAEDSWFAFELQGGEVVPTRNVCEAIDLGEPYDAGDWPIPAPIVYVQGDLDPATVYSGARAHFDSQTATDRTFVTVSGVGHTPLQWRIAGGCGASMWTAILAGSDLAATLTACGVDGMVEHAAAGG